MKNLWIVLLVAVVAIAAFVIGRRSGPAADATPPVVAPAPLDPAAAAAAERDHSKEPSSQPVRTFRGPDGLPHIIIYDPAKPPNDRDPAQVRAALIEDMKNHPKNIENSYDLTAEQIAEIVAGKRPVPDYLIPKTDAKSAP